MTKKSYLKIVYNIGARVDSALDAALTAAAEAHGWQCWASGCDHTNGERDLAFDRVQERVILPSHNHEKWLREHPGAEDKLAAFFEKEGRSDGSGCSVTDYDTDG